LRIICVIDCSVWERLTLLLVLVLLADREDFLAVAELVGGKLEAAVE